jgi:hypothetical protein
MEQDQLGDYPRHNMLLGIVIRFHWEALMRRKSSSRATPKRPYRKSFLKSALSRALAAARVTKTDVSQIKIENDGSVLLILGKPEDHESRTNPWDEVLTNASHEKRAS